MSNQGGWSRRRFVGAASASLSVAACAATADGATAPQWPPVADRWFHEPLDRQLVRALGVAATANVLDAGCGRGNHVQLFAEACPGGRVTALDLEPAVLDRIRARFDGTALAERVVGQAGDVASMPLADATFDVAWSSHTLHILADPVLGARELRRVTRPGGLVVVREDTYSVRLLPPDLGEGAPGLEDRIHAAFQRWYVDDRTARGRVPFGWSEVLARAGLVDVATRSFLFEVPMPFRADQVGYLRKRLRSSAELQHLPAADRELLLRLAEAEGPLDVFRRSDLHFTDVATLFVGRVPA